jgi:hypothetical protein
MRARLDAAGADGWSGWNLSRSAARDLLHQAYLRPATDCASAGSD